MKRVALYVRVSTEEQRDNGLSVDSQIEALEQYCKVNKYKIYDIYNDAGISARKPYKNRPALLRLIEDCKNNNIDLILFTKLDRWFRSVADYYDVQRVLDENGVKWRCIWEDYETETSAGVFKVNIMLSVAQSEADRTSERIKKVFEYKRAKGEVCSGGVAFGYKIENKRWVKDKDAEPIVNAMFDTYFSTLSNRKVQEKSIELGHMISFDAVKRLLVHPAYYGGLNYVSEAYITEEQHEIIVKSKTNKIKQHKYDYIFSGLCICGMCGYKMIGERTINKRKDGSEQHSVRYMCSYHQSKPSECYGASIKESLIEEILLDTLDEELKAYNMNRKYKINRLNDSNTQIKISNCKSRLARLKDLYELGDLTLEEYKEKRKKINEEISELEVLPEEKEITLPDYWKDAYNELDAKHKKAFWNRIIKNIVVPKRLSDVLEIRF